jgi:D-glycero-alpha-D-manno-heptose 1-phosphate guanylyltransferase
MQELEMGGIDIVILCGGLGTRLREVTKDLPKPMVNINGDPFLNLIIDDASAFGFRRFILCVGYKSEVIGNYYKKKKDRLKYVLSEEDAPMGTGGAVKKARDLIASKFFFVLNGDSICRIDLKQFLAFHLEKKAEISIALTSIENPQDYGSVSLNADHEITGFNEKTAVPSEAGWVNAGIYIFNHHAINSFPPHKKISLEYDVFPSFVGKGLYGYVNHVRLFDIGTPQRLDRLKKYFLPKEKDET